MDKQILTILNLTMSSTQNTPNKLIPALPPLNPPGGNTHEVGMVTSTEAAAATGAETSPPNVNNMLLAAPSNNTRDTDGEILEESGTADDIEATSLLNASVGGSGNVVLERDHALTPTECAAFPTKIPLVPNWFTNQDDKKIDDSYNSNGQLLYIPE